MQTKIFLVLPELLEGIDIKYMEEDVNVNKDVKNETPLLTPLFPNSTGLTEFERSLVDSYNNVYKEDDFVYRINNEYTTWLSGGTMCTKCGGDLVEYPASKRLCNCKTKTKDKDFIPCIEGNNKNISGMEILQELESLYPYQTGTGYTNDQYEYGRSSLMNKYNDFTHNITSAKGLSSTPNNTKAIKYKEENVKIVYPTYIGMSVIRQPEECCMNCGGVVGIDSSYVRGCECSITYKRTLISDSMIRISDFKINDLKEILKENIGKYDSIIIDYDFFISDLLKRECIFFYVVVPSHSLLKSMEIKEIKESETNKDLSKYKYRNVLRNGKNLDDSDSKMNKLTKTTNDINCDKQYGFMRLVTEISDIVLFLKNFKKQIEFDESIKEHVSDINNRNYNFNKYVFDMVDISIDVIK